MSETITTDELKILLGEEKPPRIIDVRRRTDYERDPSMITGATWKDPESVDTWGAELGGQGIVIYCVRGGSVSTAALEKLRALGLRARYIDGGYEAWKKSEKSAAAEASNLTRWIHGSDQNNRFLRASKIHLQSQFDFDKM